jgi:hypothetical protein
MVRLYGLRMMPALDHNEDWCRPKHAPQATIWNSRMAMRQDSGLLLGGAARIHLVHDYHVPDKLQISLLPSGQACCSRNEPPTLPFVGLLLGWFVVTQACQMVEAVLSWRMIAQRWIPSTDLNGTISQRATIWPAHAWPMWYSRVPEVMCPARAGARTRLTSVWGRLPTKLRQCLQCDVSSVCCGRSS